jgi:DDE_Tnp_1-associated
MLSIWSSLAELPGPRSGNAMRHKLVDVVTIALTASIHGVESCVDFADFGRDREPLIRDFLELSGGELPGGFPSLWRTA